MTQYKLTYFPIRGRGEIIRFVFAQAGVEYEDKRLPGAEWPAFKPSTPFGGLPILEVDGKTVLGGSLPIARFLAERHGLAGSNDIENTQIAGIIDCIHDYATKAVDLLFEKDETRKAGLKKKLVEEQAPQFLTIMDKTLSSDGWLFGSKITYADLIFYLTTENAPQEVLDKFPRLKALREKVETLPNIAKWLKDRPVTNM